MDFASSTGAAEDRTRWKGIVVNSNMTLAFFPLSV